MTEFSPFATSQQLSQRVRRETVFRLFLSDVQLQQYVDNAPTLSSLLIDFLQQFQRVDSLNHRHVGCNIFHLIRLQMTNEVPLDILG